MFAFSWKRNKDRDEFFRVVRLCCADPDFDEEERDYKLLLAGRLRQARNAAVRGDYSWRRTLIDALKPPLNNIIHWRQLPVLFQLISSPPASFRRALLNLWGGNDPLPSRIDRLAAELAKAGLLQKGFQLTTASTLLMAMGANTHPPVRSSPFRKVMIRTGTAVREGIIARPTLRSCVAISGHVDKRSTHIRHKSERSSRRSERSLVHS